MATREILIAYMTCIVFLLNSPVLNFYVGKIFFLKPLLFWIFCHSQLNLILTNYLQIHFLKFYLKSQTSYLNSRYIVSNVYLKFPLGYLKGISNLPVSYQIHDPFVHTPTFKPVSLPL